MPRSTTKTGTLALYGAPSVGHGYLAAVGAAFVGGDGEPRAAWSLTDAMWRGLADLRAAGCVSAHVHEPSGELVSTVDLQGALPYFGDLRWSAAPVYVVPAEAIASAAEGSR